MVDAIIEFFSSTLNNDILTIFIISMLPIIELRGAIPVAIEMGLTWYEAFGYAFLGSIVVAPILLLILMPILNAMKKVKFFRGIANAVESLFQSKAESVRKKANKAETKNTEDIIKMVGVFLFVAIPLPLTGVWTGTAVAIFLGLGFWKSLLAVAVGNVSSGLIMTGLSLLFKENINLFLTIFMAVVLSVLVINIIYLVVKSHLKKKKALQNGENVNNNSAQNVAKNSLESEETIVSSDNNVAVTESKNANEINGEKADLIDSENGEDLHALNNDEIGQNTEKTSENRDITVKIDIINIKNDDQNDGKN